MSSPRSGRGDKSLERVKKAVQEYGYEKLLELYDPNDLKKIIYNKDKVSLTRLGGTNIGIYKATYYSETKHKYHYILRMLPNETYRQHYFALREELEDTGFLPMQYDCTPILLNDHEYQLEIIEDCGENCSLDKFFNSPRAPVKTSSMAFSCVQQILNMMQSFYSAGYLFTDIKPSNFIVNHDGYILATDMKSILRMKKRNHTYSANEIQTTPTYQSTAWEENTKRNTCITQDALLAEISYRIGITLYEIVTGHIVTEQYRQIMLDAQNKANEALQKYKTLVNTLKNDDTLRSSLEDLDKALSARVKTLGSKNHQEINISRINYLQAQLILSIQAERNEDIGKISDHADAYLAGIQDQENITVKQLIQIHLLPEKTEEEKALRHLIMKMIESKMRDHISITEAYTAIALLNHNLDPLPNIRIPRLQLPITSGSSSPISSPTSPHSPTPITPSSSSSATTTQSAPAPHLRHSLSSHAFLYTTATTAPSIGRERSTTITADTREIHPSRTSTSPKKHKHKYQLPLIHRKSSRTLFEPVDPRDKKRSSTFASSSSAPIFIETASRPRSNTDAYTSLDEQIEHRKHHQKGKKGIQITTRTTPSVEEIIDSGQAINLKSSSAPSLTLGQSVNKKK